MTTTTTTPTFRVADGMLVENARMEKPSSSKYGLSEWEYGLFQKALAKYTQHLASLPSAPTEAASEAIAFLDEIREHEHESGERIYLDERSSEELYRIFRTRASTPPTATPEAAKEQGEVMYRLLSPMEVGTEFPKGALITGKGVFIPTTTLPASTALNDGWISVSDGLPETNEKFGESDYVLVMEEGNNQTVAWYNKKANEWRVSHHSAKGIAYVTHWQPLPTPPKK